MTLTGVYKDNSCTLVEVPEGEPDPDFQPIISIKPEKEKNTIPATDAAAYVSAVIPIPAKQNFLISRMWKNPDIIALDFKDKQSMWSSLGRIANFVEENGKKTIPGGDECPHGSCGRGQGYDFRLTDVVDFFNAAVSKEVALLPEEQELLNALIDADLITRNGSIYGHIAQDVAIIGMSRDYDVSNRLHTFVHEYSHALYFVNEEFRTSVSKTWSDLDDKVRRFLTGVIMASGFYKSGDRWLMETEAHAYAIAPVLRDDGLANLLAYAMDNCSPVSKLKACGDFWSYQGDIRSLLQYLNDKYLNLSRCNVPLLDNWQYDKNLNLIFSSDSVMCHDEHEPDTTMQPVMLIPKDSSEEKIDKFISDVQHRFDAHHHSKTNKGRIRTLEPELSKYFEVIDILKIKGSQDSNASEVTEEIERKRLRLGR